MAFLGDSDGVRYCAPFQVQRNVPVSCLIRFQQCGEDEHGSREDVTRTPRDERVATSPWAASDSAMGRRCACAYMRLRRMRREFARMRAWWSGRVRVRCQRERNLYVCDCVRVHRIVV